MSVSLHTQTRAILERYHLKPQKALSQHFLIDDDIFQAILDVSKMPDGRYLEIGTGLGILTEHIAEHAKELISLEVDDYLFEALKVRFKDFSNVKILHENILNFDPAKHFKKKKFVAIGNLPYHISGSILRWFLEHRTSFSSLYFMLQKEVGERIVSAPNSKSYGVLSLLCQFFTTPEILFEVPASSFLPPPKVESVFIKLIPKPTRECNNSLFVPLVKRAFGQRRKTIYNNLKGWDILSHEKWQALLEQLKIDPKLRAEALSLETFVKLSKAL